MAVRTLADRPRAQRDDMSPVCQLRLSVWFTVSSSGATAMRPTPQQHWTWSTNRRARREQGMDFPSDEQLEEFDASHAQTLRSYARWLTTSA
ncbi:MAG: hypothetical protein Q7L55_00210 [Actinomycetota bacterium]|nr:hypothetical protein [Actinomycetota bacterium]